MWQVIDYFVRNPNHSAADAAGHYEKEFEVERFTNALKKEAREVTRIRTELRPLYGKKQEAAEKASYALSDIETDIFLEYPPRKGTDVQREAMRKKLKAESAEYQDAQNHLRGIIVQINEWEDKLDEVEREAKNARRMLELHREYLAFIRQYKN